MAETLPDVLDEYSNPANAYKDPAISTKGYSGPMPTAPDMPPKQVWENPGPGTPHGPRPDQPAVAYTAPTPIATGGEWGHAAGELAPELLEYARSGHMGQHAKNILAEYGPAALAMFLNVNARNANPKLYQRAREMAEQGVPREDIRNQTGWHQTYADKNWLFETSDKGSKVSPRGGTYHTIFGSPTGVGPGSQFEHPRLHRDQPTPELNDLMMRLNMTTIPGSEVGGVSAAGGYMPKGTVDLPTTPGRPDLGTAPNPDMIMMRGQLTPATKRSGVLHELQHFFQEKLGMTGTGSGPANYLLEPDAIIEAIRNEGEPGIYPSSDPHDYMPFPMEGSHYGNAIVRAVNNLVYDPLAAQVQQHQPGARMIMDRPKTLKEVNALLNLWERTQGAMTDAQKASIANRTAFEVYKYLESEAYPRLVQTRRNLNTAGINRKHPWEQLDVPEHEMIAHADWYPDRRNLMLNGPGLPDFGRHAMPLIPPGP